MWRSWLPVGLGQVAIFGEHARTPHRASASVGKFAYVDRTGHVRVAVAQKELDLVHALARKQRAARDGISEAVHRGERTVRNGQRTSVLVLTMKDGNVGWPLGLTARR